MLIYVGYPRDIFMLTIMLIKRNDRQLTTSHEYQYLQSIIEDRTNTRAIAEGVKRN